MEPLISTQNVWEILATQLQRAASVRQPIEAAVGRTLQEPVVADRDLPPYTRVMMDGYALRLNDFRARQPLRVTGYQPAGAQGRSLEGLGTCVEVATGAVCPTGAELVVPYEAVTREAETVRIAETFVLPPNHFLHPCGMDGQQGDVLLAKGTRLGSRELAVAASCGYATLCVDAIPSIVVFSTGDELVPIEATPEPHQIRQSNLTALSVALQMAGFPAAEQAHLPDNPEVLQERVSQALRQHQVMVFTGSASKGKADHLPRVLETLGAKKRFHGVAQRPGKPFAFAKGAQGQSIFLLPGNPMSAMVGLHRWILPALRNAAGGPATDGQTARLAQPYSFKQPMTCFLTVARSAEGVRPVPSNNSGDFTTVLASDGFIELPLEESEFAVGGAFPFFSWQ
ncbi:MAG: molybdopterin molybdotransferase MoeA [Opitutales bacterium]